MKGGNGLFCLALLVNTQNRIDEHYHANDNDIRKSFSRIGRSDTRNHCRHHQDDEHRVRQLVQEPAENGDFLALGQLILPVFLQARRSFLTAKAVRRAANLL